VFFLYQVYAHGFGAGTNVNRSARSTLPPSVDKIIYERYRVLVFYGLKWRSVGNFPFSWVRK